MPHIKDFRRWIISPSDRTWIEPWGALVLEDGSYAIESHAISYLMTGRDLIEPARSATDEPPGPPLILANPNYDRGGPKSGPGRGMFAPLPNTETEAKAIAPRIEAYTGTRPRLLLGDQAREEALHLDRSPRVLVASTHGFYGVLRGTGITMSNPLLRCGLALTGANYRRVDAPKRPGMDGIATGLEVLGLDLRGTDLVVLSACESGKGDVLASQGMIGMNVAFQLAGARSVLATLWPIPDEETVTLISELFRHLADGQTKDEALRRAQVSLIRSLRKTRGVAHPSLWASFQMIGSLSSHPR